MSLRSRSTFIVPITIEAYLSVTPFHRANEYVCGKISDPSGAEMPHADGISFIGGDPNRTDLRGALVSLLEKWCKLSWPGTAIALSGNSLLYNGRIITGRPRLNVGRSCSRREGSMAKGGIADNGEGMGEATFARLTITRAKGANGCLSLYHDLEREKGEEVKAKDLVKVDSTKLLLHTGGAALSRQPGPAFVSRRGLPRNLPG